VQVFPGHPVNIFPAHLADQVGKAVWIIQAQFEIFHASKESGDPPVCIQSDWKTADKEGFGGFKLLFSDPLFPNPTDLFDGDAYGLLGGLVL